MCISVNNTCLSQKDNNLGGPSDETIQTYAQSHRTCGTINFSTYSGTEHVQYLNSVKHDAHTADDNSDVSTGEKKNSPVSLSISDVKLRNNLYFIHFLPHYPYCNVKIKQHSTISSRCILKEAILLHSKVTVHHSFYRMFHIAQVVFNCFDY